MPEAHLLARPRPLLVGLRTLKDDALPVGRFALPRDLLLAELLASSDEALLVEQGALRHERPESGVFTGAGPRVMMMHCWSMPSAVACSTTVC